MRLSTPLLSFLDQSMRSYPLLYFSVVTLLIKASPVMSLVAISSPCIGAPREWTIRFFDDFPWGSKTKKKPHPFEVWPILQNLDVKSPEVSIISKYCDEVKHYLLYVVFLFKKKLCSSITGLAWAD